MAYEWIPPVAAVAAFLLLMAITILCRRKRTESAPGPKAGDYASGYTGATEGQKQLGVEDVLLEVEEGDQSCAEFELHPYAPRAGYTSTTTPPRKLLSQRRNTHFSRPNRPGEWILIPAQTASCSGLYTIVLDLDETVIHTTEASPSDEASDSIELFFPEVGEVLWTHVRPNARDLFPYLASAAELLVWTAGSAEYAELVLSHLDPEQNVRFCVSRDPRWFQLPYYTKSLPRLGRQMDYVLLIDNSEYVCSGDRENCIVVEDFEGDSTDTLLYTLQEVLTDLIASNLTVPEFLRQCPRITFWGGYYRLSHQ
eukprot:TRINITY_DN2502_c0_g1_i1.p1 TRINITY_DN2502_c0_g1~~TRINITY_DN2502_c0_g1_i1.p1  ORF type:complete len:311 (-),score=36.12 TRINITY_DN2502_c0_g1_i1:339-1271(-)